MPPDVTKKVSVSSVFLFIFFTAGYSDITNLGRLFTFQGYLFAHSDFENIILIDFVCHSKYIPLCIAHWTYGVDSITNLSNLKPV